MFRIGLEFDSFDPFGCLMVLDNIFDSSASMQVLHLLHVIQCKILTICFDKNFNLLCMISCSKREL